MNWGHRLPAGEALFPLAEDFSAINWGNPLTTNIAEVFIPSTRGGMIGLRRGLYLPSRNKARVSNSPQGRYGDSVGAGMGFRELTPAALRFSTWPVTIMWVGVQLSAPDTNATYMMVNHNSDANTAPYNSYGLYFNGTFPTIAYNSAGTFASLASTVGITNNTLAVVSARITATSQQITVNGVVGATASSAISGPTYSSTSRVEIASTEGTPSRSTNARTLMGVILRGVWTNDQEREFARNPWQILSPGARLALGVIDVPTYLLLMRRPDLLLKGL